MKGVLSDHEVLGEHAVLLEAAKLQMHAYPNNVDIGLSMASYYPLGFQREELVSLRWLEKLRPNNKRLREHLRHLRSRLARRAAWQMKRTARGKTDAGE